MSGCTTSSSTKAGGNAFAAATVPSISFDSIDGPPQALFEALVASLDQEAQAQRVPVVSRSAPAAYRVRGYLAAHVEHGRTSIAWVLDVYDADRQRALRVSGQEPAADERGRKAADAWSAADERMVRRIAQTGMARIATFLQTPGARDAEPATLQVAAAEVAPEPAGTQALAFATRD